MEAVVEKVNPVKTSNRIREVRMEMGLSQSELGRRVGLSEPAINRYERGRRRPTAEKLREIANALGVPLIALFVKLDVEITEGNVHGGFLRGGSSKASTAVS